MVGGILFCFRKCGILLDWSRALTHSWSLIVLKISLTESLNEVKWCFVWKDQSGLEQRIRRCVFWRQVVPDSDLGYGQRPLAEISTFFRRHLISQYGWRRFSLPPSAGCRAELITESIQVTLCLRQCMYMGWKTSNSLMNTSAETFSPQLRSWQVGFERSWCMIWDCRSALSWWRGGDDYSSWPPTKGVLVEQHFSYLLEVVERARR